MTARASVTPSAAQSAPRAPHSLEETHFRLLERTAELRRDCVRLHSEPFDAAAHRDFRERLRAHQRDLDAHRRRLRRELAPFAEEHRRTG